MSENTDTPVVSQDHPTEVADATGNEDLLEQTEFPEEEYPLPPQNDTDLGLETVITERAEDGA